MRHRLLAFPQRTCRLPGVLTLLVVLASAGPALAGRSRAEIARTGETLPAVPEPGAAIVFALGVGAVAWAVRRHRR